MGTCIVIGLSFHFCHRFRFGFSPLDRKRRSHKRIRKKMETFWFFRLRLCRANDFAYESNFWFPQGHKRSYDELISTKGGNMKRTKNAAAYTRQLKKKHVTFLALTSRLNRTITWKFRFMRRARRNLVGRKPKSSNHCADNGILLNNKKMFVVRMFLT